jgi:hypothetical protein
MPLKRKRSLWVILLVLLLLVVAYATKPTDKNCIIAAVEGVWGMRTPDKGRFPEYFEQFMDLNSKSVMVDDWVFLKRLRYRFGQEYRTVGYGAFTRIFYVL